MEIEKVNKLIKELDLLIRMDIPKESHTDYAIGPQNEENFDITYNRYIGHAVSNRMTDLRKTWKSLKQELGIKDATIR